VVKSKLKEIRMKEYMLNLTDFAKTIDVDMKILSSWEKNKSRPTLERALDVARKLNKNVNEIWYLE
jgi:DNA-binding XRE family transcriptional regulator